MLLGYLGRGGTWEGVDIDSPQVRASKWGGLLIKSLYRTRLILLCFCPGQSSRSASRPRTQRPGEGRKFGSFDPGGAGPVRLASPPPLAGGQGEWNREWSDLSEQWTDSLEKILGRSKVGLGLKIVVGSAGPRRHLLSWRRTNYTPGIVWQGDVSGWWLGFQKKPGPGSYQLLWARFKWQSHALS